MKSRKSPYHRFTIILVASVLMLLCSFNNYKPKAPISSHSDLIALFKVFDHLRHPGIKNGIPDYSAAAMAHQFDSLKIMQANLSRMDTTGWTKDQQIDYRLVEAHMHGLEFNHRIMHRWSRDPAYYSTINWFNPTMEGAFDLPQLPLPEKSLKAFQKQMEMMPIVLAAAKINLTEMTPDFAILGIERKKWEEEQYKNWLPQLARFHPELIESANKMVAAIVDFRKWIKAKLPSLNGRSGIGIDNYNWLLKNV